MHNPSCDILCKALISVSRLGNARAKSYHLNHALLRRRVRRVLKIDPQTSNDHLLRSLYKDTIVRRKQASVNDCKRYVGVSNL